MSKKNKGNGGIAVHRPKTFSEFQQLNQRLNANRYVAIDVLKSGAVRNISLAVADAANAGARDMAEGLGRGAWSNGPLSKVAWAFDGRTDTVEHVTDKDGKPLGDGYVKWGAGDNIPSVIPPLAMSSPYTAAPLRYIADLTTGLGVRLMYRFPDGEMVEFKDAGERLQAIVDELEENESQNSNATQFNILGPGGTLTENEPKENIKIQRAREALKDWERTWYGFEVEDETVDTTHVPGAKEFLEENNLDLHLSQCMQDNVMLDIYFPTVGLQRGRARRWDYPTKPRIIRCDVLPAHSCRLGTMDSNRYIHHAYFSDSLRKKGAGVGTTTIGNATQDNAFKMYPCAMPQHLLSEIRYIVDSNLKTRIKDRPTWIVCPTLYPSGQKPYYPQPAWWSVFTSKAFDFSATILYDKYKSRENSTTWGRILYISLDYLDQVFADEGYQGDKDKQQEFIDNLDNSVEQFLQQRENNGKMMRQFMWTGPDGKDHKNVEVVDIKETTNDAVKAGKEELELSTSPIFLALQVDPRLVGVPMVAASNGGTALREMHLLKQQQLSVHKRNYERFLNAIATYNEWPHAEFHIVEQTLTTLDNSKTGTVETISGEGA